MLVLRPSVVCNVYSVAKRCVSLKNSLKQQIGNSLLGIEWSRNRRHVTLKGRRRDSDTLTIRYDTIVEFNVDSKAEYTA